MPDVSSRLLRLEITPGSSSIALGQTVQFKATGIFNDGSSKDETESAVWKSSNSGVAKIDARGLSTSFSVGRTMMVANVAGIESSAPLIVSKASMVNIVVDPPVSSIALGTTAQLKATATFTDSSKQDVTNRVTWVSSEPDIVVISSTGLAFSRSAGNASITATSGAVNASSQLTVTPAALVNISVSQDRSAVALGTGVQFKAQGVYTDGSTRDLTSSVSWSSSPQGVVRINTSGLATGLKMGTATVNARSESITGAGTLTVSAALLTSIAVTSDKVMMPLGTAQQMTAIGTYSDGSTRDLSNSVSWSSASHQIVEVSSSGLASAKALGTAVVSASASGISGAAPMTVSSPTLTSISVSPLNPTVPLLGGIRLSASGSFTDGSTQDLTSAVTWSVEKASVVNVSSTGNATAQRVGSTGVTATYSGIEGTTSITVEPIASVSYFAIEPNGVDTSLRFTNPGGDQPDLCAMVYVFDQDQQMAECCGCRSSQDGLRTLSLNKNLTGNPLTGQVPVTGSILLVTADYGSNPSCNASSITPAGSANAWATHLQSLTPDADAVFEESLSQIPLRAPLASSLQAQCSFIQQLGGGQGICSCGTGH